MSRKTLAASLLVLGLLATGCASLNRAGKDAFIVVTSPAVILYGASTDAVADTENLFASFEQDDRAAWLPTLDPITSKPPRLLSFLTFPFAFVYNAGVHTYYVVRHAFDLVLFPFYGLADLHPHGPEIKPLDIYTGTYFDDWAERNRRSPNPDHEGTR